MVSNAGPAAAAGRLDRPEPQRLPGGLHGLSRTEVVASQRNRLLQAMVEVVGEQGYAETNVSEVLARAGVSRKTFYELFATKDDCLLAVYDETARCLRDVVQRARDRGVTPREQIDAAIDIVLDWIAAEPARARLCVLEVPTSGIAGQRRMTATLSWLSGVMAEVLGDLEVPELLPELLVGGVHQMIAHRLVNDIGDVPLLAGDLSEVWDQIERWGHPPE